MVTYKLTSSAWLVRETERVKGIFLANLEKAREYTAAELVALAQDFGLAYQPAEMVQIRDALIADGTIEESA